MSSSPDPRQPPVPRLTPVTLQPPHSGSTFALAALVTLLRDGAQPVAAALRGTAHAARPPRGGDAVGTAAVPRVLAAFLFYHCFVCNRNVSFFLHSTRHSIKGILFIDNNE